MSKVEEGKGDKEKERRGKGRKHGRMADADREGLKDGKAFSQTFFRLVILLLQC